MFLTKSISVNIPCGEELSSMPLYKIEGSIHSMPYNDSKILCSNETIGFILWNFVNFMDEEWYYVESFNIELSNNRYGFILAAGLGEKLVMERGVIQSPQEIAQRLLLIIRMALAIIITDRFSEKGNERR